MRTKVIALSALFWLCGIFIGMAIAEPAKTQPPSSPAPQWAYQMLNNLAQRGLLAGYPAQPLAGPTAPTRFEAASLVLRAVQGVGQQLQHQGQALEGLAQPPSGPPTTEEEQPAPTPTVTAEDMARLEKLLAEFRNELVTMGARVDEIEKSLSALQTRVTKVEKTASESAEELRRHHLSGYIQWRFETNPTKDVSNNFRVRRARVVVSGPLSKETSYKIQLQLEGGLTSSTPGTSVALRDATIIHNVGPVQLQVGQFKVPFSYELDESSSARLGPERALFWDVLFPDQRDIGLALRYQPNSKSVALDLGIFNGTGINKRDNNNRKDVVTRLTIPTPVGGAIVSYYTGEFTDSAGVDTARQRVGVGTLVQRKTWAFRTEFLRGQDLGHPVEGWYALLRHAIPGTKATVFGKYDTFDENRDLSNDEYRQVTMGAAYDLNPSTRLTLAYSIKDADSGFSRADTESGSRAMVQLQVIF